MDKIDQLFEFFESPKGSFSLAVVISVAFVITVLNSSSLLLSPGLYIFGAALPAGLFLWSASNQTNLRARKLSWLCCFSILAFTVVTQFAGNL